MPPLASERLILRDWQAEDADFVYDLYSRWEVQRYVGAVPRVMEDRAEAEAVIARWQSTERPPPQGVWAVADRDSGRLLGTLLLKDIPASGEQRPLLPSGDVEIGWHFHPDAWGHGYATEAAGVVLERAFEAGLRQVVAVTHPRNSASQQVCRRLGMRHEGQTARYYNATCELFTVTSQA